MRFPTAPLGLAVLVCVLFATPGLAQPGPTTWPVANDSELRNALTLANAGDTIVFTANITLASDLPFIGPSLTRLTIDGAGFTLSGASLYRGFVVGDVFSVSAPIPVTATIQNLTIANTLETGGAGADSIDGGGGGGGGLGGAIFIATAASVTITNVSINGSGAVGGTGGDPVGSPFGGAGGTGTGNTGTGGTGSQQIPTSGGYSGGAGGTLFGSPTSSQFAGGTGGSGSGTAGGGGGGALGGAIFVENGGSLSINGLSVNGSAVTGGLGGTGAGDGSAYGSGIFLAGSGFITFDQPAGTTATINDAIADEFGSGGGRTGIWTVSKAGPGTLVLGGTNTYSGGTEILNGTLRVFSDANLGSGTVRLFAGGILDLAGSNTFNQLLLADNGATLRVGSGVSATWNNAIEDLDSPSRLFVTGGGTLTLTSNLNSFSNGLAVIGNTTVQFSDDAALGALGVGIQLGDVTGNGTLRLTSGLVNSDRNVLFGGTGTGTLDVAAGSQLTLTGIVSGSASLTKAGTGTLVLSGANTYLGTTVAAGTLRAGAIDVFGTGRMDVQTGATLDLVSFSQTLGSIAGGGSITLGAAGTILSAGADGTSTTFSGVMSGAGRLEKFGAGRLTLLGANTYSGGTQVWSGALEGTTTSLQGNIGNAGIVAFNQGFDGTYAGAITGTGSLEKLGTGTVTMTGANTYSGGTTVQGGTLAGTSTSLQGNILNNAAVRFDQAFNGAYTGVMNGTGSLTKTGTGTLTLTGLNTYTGATSVTGGTLQAGLASVFSSSSAFAVGAGATLDVNGTLQSVASVSGAGAITLGTGGELTSGGDNSSTTFSGIVSGAGRLVKTGTGTLTLTGANVYSGGTTVSQGRLLGNSTSLQGAIANSGIVEFNQTVAGTYAGAISGFGSVVKSGGGTLTLTGTNIYTGGTTISGGTLVGSTASIQGNVLNNAAIVFNQAGAGTFAGVISGAGSFTKTGLGLLTLASAQTYTGATAIDAGVLRAGATNVFAATSGVSIASGAIFDLSGFNQTVGTLSGGGDIALGSATLTTGGTSTTLTGVISGSGSLVKTGPGDLTLLGANNYTGGTTITGGSLIGNTTSLQGDIVNNANATFDQGFAGTYAGSMSGVGSLTKNGAGALTLTGLNTYTGGTTVNGGTLIGNTSSFTGSITSNGLVVFNQTTAGTFTGSLGGTGSLQKIGGGTLTLGSTGTFTGTTTISEGVLRAGAPNVFGSIAGIALDPGTTLDLNGFNQTLNAVSGSGTIALGGATLTTGTNGASTTIASVITGSGSLVKAGGGTLALTGANSYTGGTIVSGGILLGTTTSVQGNILNNSRVVFDQAFNGTYAGNMSGTGILEKAGSGALTLTGTNTYSGGTVISGGSLVASASSLSGTVLNNGQLTFGGASDGAFNGVIGGVGNLVKTGAGTLSMTGNHPFSGLTTVAQGTLSLNGNLGGSVVVQPGAFFGAAGTLFGGLTLNGTLVIPTPAFSAALTLTADGRQAASSGDRLTTPPLFTIDGNFVAGEGSVLGLPLGPGPNPSMFVTGVAALNGATLDARPIELGTQRVQSFLAMTAAGGLTVANTGVITQSPLLIPSLRSDGHTLAVSFINLGAPLELAANPELRGVGAAIDRLKGDLSGDRGVVVRELFALDDDELQNALQQIAGEIHSTRTQVDIRSAEIFTDLVRNMMSDRDHEAPEDELRRSGPGWIGHSVRFFGQFGRENVSFDGVNGAAGGGADISDGAGGFEVKLSNSWLLGGGGGFGFGSMALDGLAAGSDFLAPRAFGVVGFRPKAFAIRGGGSLARSKSKTKRQIAYIARLPELLGGLPLTGGIDREALTEEVTVQNDQWGEFADHFNYGTYRVDYFVGVRRAHFSRDGFIEAGAGALSLESDGVAFNLTDADVKVHWWRRSGGIRPYAEVFVRRTSGLNISIPVEFSDEEDSDFDSKGLPMGQNAFSARIGTTFVQRIGSLTVEYRYRRTSVQTGQAFDMRFRF